MFVSYLKTWILSGETAENQKSYFAFKETQKNNFFYLQKETLQIDVRDNKKIARNEDTEAILFSTHQIIA